MQQQQWFVIRNTLQHVLHIDCKGTCATFQIGAPRRQDPGYARPKKIDPASPFKIESMLRLMKKRTSITQILVDTLVSQPSQNRPYNTR